MRNLDFNQNSILNIFINLEIIGEEDKNKKKYYTIYIYIYILFYKKTKNISAIWCCHLPPLRLLNPTFIIYTISKRILFFGLNFYGV